jgi:hypothetical protein
MAVPYFAGTAMKARAGLGGFGDRSYLVGQFAELEKYACICGFNEYFLRRLESAIGGPWASRSQGGDVASCPKGSCPRRT